MSMRTCCELGEITSYQATNQRFLRSVDWGGFYNGFGKVCKLRSFLSSQYRILTIKIVRLNRNWIVINQLSYWQWVLKFSNYFARYLELSEFAGYMGYRKNISGGQCLTSFSFIKALYFSPQSIFNVADFTLKRSTLERIPLEVKDSF